ncbi:MAG: hypothetical protein HY718_19695 [Planctomycetes bacterium]|nr:hypothetical protein [Planctomycetota bacterium]
MSGKSIRGWWILSSAFAAVVQVAFAEDPSFTGTGRLAPNAFIKAFGVSAGGGVAVGDAVDASRNTQAFVWTAAGGLHGIGFPSSINRESHATDVGVTSTGQLKVCGYGRDDINKIRAFLWTGDATGTGTFELLPLLTGGTQNWAYGLYVTALDVVLLTGDSESSASPGARQGFYWKTGEPDSEPIGFLNGGTPESHGVGIGLEGGQAIIVGRSNSRWSAGLNARETCIYKPGENLRGDKGLAWVCGRGWQILAGPNGIAETTAFGSDQQLIPVGTTGLSPDAVVVTTGADNILDTTTITGDDVEVPIGHNPTDPLDPEYKKAESLYRAVSPDGRYKVGRSTYGGTGLFEANLRDPKNRDYEANDHCGGIAFHWPLGFLNVGNTGAAITDNYSEALGVSNSAASPSRNGLIVAGWSTHVGGDTTHRAFVCMIQDGLDLWFLRQQGADPTDLGAYAASRFKDMRNLQWLLSHDYGLDLAGWDLREATAVSNTGGVVVGWGLHDGVEEGFVATIPALPSKGACCHRPSLECTLEFPGDCDGEWLGPETVCTRCCPKPFSDADQDGDVDAADFARFQACLNTGGGAILAGCECWDQDENGLVEETDFIHGFVNCGTGAEIPADPDCN